MDTDKNQNEDIEGIQYNPTGLYNDTVQEILRGFLAGIKLRSGQWKSVTQEDILAGSSVNPLVLSTYFNTMGSVMGEVHSELKKIIGLVETNMQRYRKDVVLNLLLENFRKQPLMLKIMVETNDSAFFEANMKNILLFVTVPEQWGEQDAIWEDIYKSFCPEFLAVIRWWAESDFADDEMEEAFLRMRAWVEANARYRMVLKRIKRNYPEFRD